MPKHRRAKITHWHATLLPEGGVQHDIAPGPVGTCCSRFASWQEVMEHEAVLSDLST